MATTKNTKGKDKTPPDPNALRVEVQPDDNHSEKLAALATDGALTAITLQAYAGGGKELGVTELLAAMRKAGDETVAGDMGRFERVLTHQFLTLDALFNNLAQRSGRQESFKGIEVLMRLALKAQALLAAEKIAVRVVSMPSTTTFDREEVKYKKAVLPTGIPRIAVEMGVTDGWWKYGCAAVVGIDTYGESAPAPVLFKHFGFTPENVADTVRAALRK